MKNGVIRERDFKDHFSYWLDLMAEDGDRMELTKRKVLWDYFGNISLTASSHCWVW
jgi:hypothetical protein